MKFYSRDDERALGSALSQVRGSRGFEPDDLWAIPRRRRSLASRIGIALVLGIAISKHLQENHVFIEPAWQHFAVGMWFFLEALFASGRLIRRLMRHPTSQVLQMLPVKGESIALWARDDLVVSSWTIGLRALVISAILNLISDLATFSDLLLIVGHAVTLWGITLATAALICRGRWEGVGWDWAKHGIKFLTLILLLGIGAHFWEWPKLLLTPLMPYMNLVTCWLPAWSLGTSEITSTGMVVTLLWLGAGTMAALHLPVALGSLLDRPRIRVSPRPARSERVVEDDERQDAPNKGLESESKLREHASPGPDVESVNRRLAAFGALTEAARTSRSLDLRGWIERLCWSVLSVRQRTVLTVIWPLFPQWTRSWRLAGLMFTALTGVAAIAHFIPDTPLRKWLSIFIGFGYLVVLVRMIFPFSNNLGRAFMIWPMGQSFTLRGTLLPITIKDLSGIAIRLTWVRTLAAITLASLAVFMITTSLDTGLRSSYPFAPGVHSAMIVTAGLLGWAAHRPLFILYRLQINLRRGQGSMRFWVHLLLSLLLWSLVLVTCLATFIMGIGAPAIDGGWASFAAALGIVVLSHTLQWLWLKCYVWMYRRLGMDVIARAGAV